LIEIDRHWAPFTEPKPNVAICVPVGGML
jgi:hypothetical protein